MPILLISLSLVAGVFAALRMRWGFYFFLFTYPVVPSLLALGVGSAGFALSLQRIILCELCIFYVLHAARRSRQTRQGLKLLGQHRQVGLPLICILLVGSVAALLQGEFDVGTLSAIVDRFFFTVFILVLTVTTLETRRHVVTACALLVGALLVNHIEVVIELLTQRPLLQGLIAIDYDRASPVDVLGGRERGGRYRVMGSFHNPLALAAFICFTVPIAWSLAAKWRSAPGRVASMAAVVGAIPAIWFTGSRAGMVVLVFLGWFYAVKRAWVVRRVSSRLLLVVGMSLPMLIAAIPVREMLVEYLVYGPTGAAYSSTLTRQEQFSVALPLFNASPVYGYGFSRNIVERLGLVTLDSYYLRTALEAGGLGILCLILMLLATSRLILSTIRVADTARDRSLLLALGAAVGSLTLFMFGSSNPYNYGLLYFAIGSAIIMKGRIGFGAQWQEGPLLEAEKKAVADEAAAFAESAVGVRQGK